MQSAQQRFGADRGSETMSGVVIAKWRYDLERVWNALTQRHVRTPSVAMSNPFIQDRSQVRSGKPVSTSPSTLVEWFQLLAHKSRLPSDCAAVI